MSKHSPFGVESAAKTEGLAPRRARRIYLLPNALTTAALFCGFFAIIQAIENHFDFAAMAVFVGMIFDLLDGRVARLTNTQTEFGEQYDSLSDMVSFGLAPALVVYEWSLWSLGKLGWLAAFVYVASAALRLARFNTGVDLGDKRFFQGMPSPAAAGLLAGLVWIATDLKASGWIVSAGRDFAWPTFFLSLCCGVSMVSNIKFYSFKQINFKRSVPFVFLVALVLFFALVSFDPPLVLFSVFLLYGVSGYGYWMASFFKPEGKVETLIGAPEYEQDHVSAEVGINPHEDR